MASAAEPDVHVDDRLVVLAAFTVRPVGVTAQGYPTLTERVVLQASVGNREVKDVGRARE